MTPFFRKLQENDEPVQPTLKPNPYLNQEKSPVNQDIRVGEVRATFGHVDRDEQIHRLRFMQENDSMTSSDQGDDWEERQSPLNFVILASLVIILVVLGWFGYRWFANSYNETPPVLMADESPYKVRPDNPGGMIIPHQDKLIYGRIAPQQNQMPERLLPQPEAPVLPEQNYVPAQNFEPQSQMLYDQYGNPVQPQGYVPQHHQSHAPMPAGQPYQGPGQQQIPYQGGYGYPPQQAQPQQQYMPVQATPQGQAGSMSHSNQAVAPAYPQQPVNQPTQPPVVHEALPATVAEPAVTEDTQDSQVDPLDDLVSAEASRVEKVDSTKLKMASLNNDSPYASQQPVRKQSAKEDIKSAVSNQGYYRVQLGTFPTDKEAKVEIRRLKSLDGSAFSGKKFIIQKSTNSSTGKAVYKVMVGFFPSANTANTFKNKLKIHRVNGAVVKG